MSLAFQIILKCSFLWSWMCQVFNNIPSKLLRTGSEELYGKTLIYIIEKMLEMIVSFLIGERVTLEPQNLLPQP